MIDHKLVIMIDDINLAYYLSEPISRQPASILINWIHSIGFDCDIYAMHILMKTNEYFFINDR